MRFAIRPTLVLGLLLLPASASAADTTVIRTFVNGVTAENSSQQVHDLHIEYDQQLFGAGFAGEASVAEQKDVTITDRRVDIKFKRALMPNESVTALAITHASSLNILTWWWTDGAGGAVKRTVTYVTGRGRHTRQKEGEIEKYDGELRGDEAQIASPRPQPMKIEDPYAIVNKSHHWGGAARRTQKVKITLNISKLLADAPNGLDKDLIAANIRAAVKQWADCTSGARNRQVPRSGQNGNPANHGEGVDPANMAPGPSHMGGKGIKFRSVADRECNAAFLKYPQGIEITVIETQQPEGEITGHFAIPPGHAKALGYGPSQPSTESGQTDRTTSGDVYMTNRRNAKWHLAMDTDGDGYITNKDADEVPEDEYDFYSVFKHELGHVLCFNHAGENFSEEDVHFEPAQPLDDGRSSPGDDNAAQPSNAADDEYIEPGPVYFSSNREGGYGGFDLWVAEPTDEGVVVTNLGPQVNSSGNDVDPFLAADGTTLLFSSDRSPSSQYSLYRSVFDLKSALWQAAAPLGPGVSSPFNDRHPTLQADMKTLYFSSDRPGGYGKDDIWTAEFIEYSGLFSDAVNLGAAVNSADNERDPAVSGDGGVLYLSSDRAGGSGGFDLYVAGRVGGWRAPLNLGAAVNSPFDEVGPGIRIDDRILAFASDRPGGMGGFDLYEAAFNFSRQGEVADLDGDGAVFLNDLRLFVGAYDSCFGDESFSFAADFDYDGCVGPSDYFLLLRRFGSGAYAPGTAATPQGGTSSP